MISEHPKALIALATSEKWHAKILRYLMDSRFHHALVFVYLEEFGGWMAIDTDRRGPHLVTTERIFEKISDFECYYSKESLFKGIAKCRNFLSNDYDTKGAIFGTILLVLKKIFSLKPKRNIQDSQKAYCLEYVASVLKYSGVPSFKHENVSLLTTLNFESLIDSDPTVVKFNITKLELLNEKTLMVEG